MVIYFNHLNLRIGYLFGFFTVILTYAAVMCFVNDDDVTFGLILTAADILIVWFIISRFMRFYENHEDM